jgi:hypothetical protein
MLISMPPSTPTISDSGLYLTCTFWWLQLNRAVLFHVIPSRHAVTRNASTNNGHSQLYVTRLDSTSMHFTDVCCASITIMFGVIMTAGTTTKPLP